MKLGKHLLVTTKIIRTGCEMAFHHHWIAIIAYELRLASERARQTDRQTHRQELSYYCVIYVSRLLFKSRS